MEHKHTPGPWQFLEFELYEGSGKRFNISQAEGAAFTSGYSDVAQTIEGERLSVQEANARLIAAAPKLLEALKLAEEMLCKQENAMRSMGCYEPCPEVAILTARDAITKATGATHE